jgi:hypothetical protein
MFAAVSPVTGPVVTSWRLLWLQGSADLGQVSSLSACVPACFRSADRSAPRSALFYSHPPCVQTTTWSYNNATLAANTPFFAFGYDEQAGV